MKIGKPLVAILLGLTSLAQAAPTGLRVGEPFIKARARLGAEGWRADPLAHAASGDYMALERQLVQNGYTEVDYCSLGVTICVLQYTKGNACLRLHTQGEQIRSMVIERWSNDCREKGEDEAGNMLPADVRYIVQWRNDCDKYGQCKGMDAFLLKLKKKYARDPAIMRLLRSDINPVEISPPAKK